MTQEKSKELEAKGKKPIEKTEGEPTREGVTYVPDVDIIESSESITLLAELPGVKKDEVDIDVREGVLTLNATVSPVPSRLHPVYREYDVGGFSRRFSMGERIDQSKISAKMENGVLRLVLPKAEQARPRKIEIG